MRKLTLSNGLQIRKDVMGLEIANIINDSQVGGKWKIYKKNANKLKPKKFCKDCGKEITKYFRCKECQIEFTETYQHEYHRKEVV